MPTFISAASASGGRTGGRPARRRRIEAVGLLIDIPTEPCVREYDPDNPDAMCPYGTCALCAWWEDMRELAEAVHRLQYMNRMASNRKLLVEQRVWFFVEACREIDNINRITGEDSNYIHTEYGDVWMPLPGKRSTT
jgi:hypothetical protein